MNQFFLLLYSVAYLLLDIYLIRTKKSRISIFICSLWLISSLAANIYYLIYYQFYGPNIMINPFALVYLFVGFFISLYPYTFYKESQFKINGNYKILYLFSVFIISLNIIPFIGNLIYFMHHLADLSHAGSEYGEDVQVLTSTAGVLARYALYLRIFTPILLFYFLQRQGNKWIILGLILSFANPIIGNLNIGSRFGFVLETLYIISLYLMFSKTLNKKRKLIFKRSFIISFILAGTVFIAITMFRFSGTKEFQEYNPILVTTSLYAGESAVNFSTQMWGNEKYTNGENCFFIFKHIFGEYDSIYRNVTRLSYTSSIPLHIFYTFIGDFYVDFGPVLTYFILSLFAFFILTKIYSYNKNLGFCDIVWIAFMLKILVSGFTYYPYMNSSMEIVYAPIVNLILTILLKLNNKKI